jgi:hypothetical protein
VDGPHQVRLARLQANEARNKIKACSSFKRLPMYVDKKFHVHPRSFLPGYEISDLIINVGK